MKHTLTVTVLFTDVMILKYHVQFVMSVIVLQSTWFLLSTYMCPTGWTREYYGYLMAERTHSVHRRAQYTCMDTALKPANGSLATDHDGLVFYFVEGRCGSLPCPPYDQTRELSCSVCTK